MSEQPQSQQSAQEYSIPSRDGAARMDADTDVWLKASELPLRRVSAEQPRSKTEAEVNAERVRRAAVELANLNVVRLDAMRIEERPFMRDQEAA